MPAGNDMQWWCDRAAGPHQGGRIAVRGAEKLTPDVTKGYGRPLLERSASDAGHEATTPRTSKT